LIHRIINRDCGIGQEGIGIPQGHIASGALANVYLSRIDALFAPGNFHRVEYFRFVDDMTLIIPPDIEVGRIIEILDKELDALGLTRSEGKTKILTAEKFLEISTPDEILEELGQAHNFLLSELYKLDNDYIRLALEDWWSFVEHYQKLLMSVGVFISVPRLSRKLQKNLTWWKRLFYFWRRLKLPSIQTFDDLKDVESWKNEFILLNAKNKDGWISRRESLAQELASLFQDSLAALNSASEIEKSRAQTRIKFALHRLGQLGFGENTAAIVRLLKETPWVLHPRRICRDLALQSRSGDLVEVYQSLLTKQSEEWVYIRATVLKSFAFLPFVEATIVALLQDVAANGATNLERTMASESLLFLKQFEFGQTDQLAQAIEDSADDYLSKNYILLKRSNLAVSLSNRRILNSALDYIRVDPKIELIYRYEPEILRENFYEGEYPDGPEEFEYCSY
jgi:hypothetical protein